MITVVLGDTGFQKNKCLDKLFRVEFINLRPFFKTIFYQSEDSGSQRRGMEEKGSQGYCSYIYCTYHTSTVHGMICRQKHSGTTHT